MIRLGDLEIPRKREIDIVFSKRIKGNMCFFLLK